MEMIPLFVILAVGLLTTVFFIYEKVKKYSVKDTIIKATASVLFISLAVVANYLHGNTWFGMFAIIALALGMLGDIWLELKYVFPQEDKLFTYAGFICFALGHVCYITGMFLEFYTPAVENILYAILPFVAGLIIAVITIVVEKPLKLSYGKEKLICFIYSVLLFSMFATTVSFSIMYQFRNVTLIMMMGGALLFAVSDLVLCQTYFGKGHDKPFDLISNSLMYYIAQYTIAFSIYMVGVFF